MLGNVSMERPTQETKVCQVRLWEVMAKLSSALKTEVMRVGYLPSAPRMGKNYFLDAGCLT